ncbi:hypothetical protein NQ318_016412 [Aromia moschata]|uniref:PNPLA domain-containing protein n=1 Tax=Aromia moschata TaxID=1265417 RepID=A0AAV8Z654_9CUCU|nr:hypothetical protein NQ318_016412 [Aromia moschata]
MTKEKVKFMYLVQQTTYRQKKDTLNLKTASKWKQNVSEAIEGFIAHVKQYPEIKNKAAKAGAVGQEALAILGYADPVPGKGIRILSIDGGGIRGLLVLEMLKKLEELTGKRVYQLFDFFCGVSTGAILSFTIGIHHRTLDEISFGYEAISREVFKQSSWRGTGSLVWNHSYYDTTLWEKNYRNTLAKHNLFLRPRDPKCPKLCAVSAVYLGSNDCEVWQAARASAAAPTYFEEFKLGNLLHQLIWPNTPIQCVVSFGTGRTVLSPSEFTSQSDVPESVSTNTSWANKFYKILDSATDTEGVHTMLNDLLPDRVYYRFNPYLTEMVSMVETDNHKLEQLRRDAIMYLRRNEDKFHEVAKVLLEKRARCRQQTIS